MMLKTKGLALLQGDLSLELMAERLDKAAKVIRAIERSLEDTVVTIKLAHSPSHDFELIASAQGIAQGPAQRGLAHVLEVEGYQGQTQGGEGWAATVFDVWAIRFAVIWPTQKED